MKKFEKIKKWFMKLIQNIWAFITIDNLIRFVNFISFLVFTAYVYSMFFKPFIDGGWSWKYIHGVWYSWQALNVGMLAFGSSVIAFNISRYHAAKQQEREFIAAKAFLPQALSDLCGYFKSSAPLLIETYHKAKDRKLKKQPLQTKIPETPQSHIPIFKECIKSARPSVAEYLAKILMLLQVHDARMQAILTDSAGNPAYRKSCLYSLAELQVLINSLFDFARAEASFSSSTYTEEEFTSAFRSLGLVGDDRDELIDYAKEKIAAKTRI